MPTTTKSAAEKIDAIQASVLIPGTNMNKVWRALFESLVVIAEALDQPRIDRARYARIRDAAKGWVSECDRPGDDPGDAMRRAGLEPTDLEDLPEEGGHQMHVIRDHDGKVAGVQVSGDRERKDLSDLAKHLGHVTALEVGSGDRICVDRARFERLRDAASYCDLSITEEGDLDPLP